MDSYLKRKTRLKARRSLRVRSKVRGTSARPRLSVFRSNLHFYLQIIDDEAGKTLVSLSTLQDKKQASKGIAAAEQLGEAIAKLAKEKNIDKVVLDRGPYRFHGQVKAMADSARKAGLEF